MIQIIKYLYTFFTLWSLTLYTIFIIINSIFNIKVPLFITNFLLALVISNSIWGTVIIQTNINKIKKTIYNKFKFKLSTGSICLLDIISHTLPLLYIIYHKNDQISNSIEVPNSFIKSIILCIVYSTIYLNIFDVSDVYFNTNKYLLIIPPMILFTFNLYLLNNR